MLSRLKLKGQMLVGYAVPIAIYLGLAGLVYSTAQQVTSTFQELERVQQVLLKNNELDRDVQGMVRGLRGFLAARQDKFDREYQESLQSVKEVIPQLEALIRVPEQKQRLQRIVEVINLYDRGATEQIQLMQQGKAEEALRILRSGRVTAFVNEYDKLSNEFLITEQQKLEKESNQAKAAINALVTALILGSLVLFASAVAIAMLISSSVSRTIHHAVNTIASSSSEIATTVEQHERTANQQAAAVNQTTTTMDELGVASRQSAEQAEVAASSARRILSLVDQQSYMNGQTIHNGNSLREKVGRIADQILRLSEQTSQIGLISGLVSELANQTNMLALNAAVEAVRAGEHGKGFGVVAAEIRKLADQSKKSAEQISGLVTEVQNATNSTVMVTDEGTKTVEGIVAEINDIVINIQHISLTSQQQATAIQQVVDAMNSINHGAVQTAAGISQTKVGTHKLNEAAISLKAIV